MAESRTENTAENLANEKKGSSCSNIELKLSEYDRKLNDHVKRRYMEKISVIGVDPCLIPEEKFNPEVLPPVEGTNLLPYLVLDTSFYTKQQFKSFRSLMHTSRWFLVLLPVFKAKVRHSQRMNDLPIPVWIISGKDSTVICAYCIGCMYGRAG